MINSGFFDVGMTLFAEAFIDKMATTLLTYQEKVRTTDSVAVLLSSHRYEDLLLL